MKAIEIKNLEKKYGENTVLDGVSFSIESGDFFALLGHNGAGKTTLISILTNLVNKTTGKVKINGVDIDKDFQQARTYIGVVPQEFNFDIFSKVIDIPLIQAGYYGIDKETALKRTEKYLKKLGLWEKRNARARELSGGMKRRLMIVRALVHKPKILILDEPTAGVDVELRKSMWEFIQELNDAGTTILLTTHYLEEVESLCKNVAIMHKGKIVENTSVKALLSTLKKETIILTVDDNSKKLNKDFVKQYGVNILPDNEMELEITKKHSLNELFQQLDKENISVLSFRNKTNRLEALFMKLLK
ncbi:MAG: ABC transporter ATP-binding protein [Candidatus Gracilibacteria bacterium]|nr:ABC transporter ATP-binding protein [Candidatus Gracilibacteria bacterium]